MKFLNKTNLILFAFAILAISASALASDKPSAKKSEKKVFGPEAIFASKPSADFDYAKKRKENGDEQNAKLDTDLISKVFGLSSRAVTISQQALDQVSSLLRDGANPNAQGEPADQGPIHHAVFDNTKSVLVKQLLNWKANPNLQDSKKQTALHIAAKNDNYSATRILLMSGAQELLDDENRLPSNFTNTASKKNKATRQFFIRALVTDNETQEKYKAYKAQLIAITTKTLKDMNIPTDLIEQTILTYIPTDFTYPDDLPETTENRSVLLLTMPTHKTESRSALADVEHKDDVE